MSIFQTMLMVSTVAGLVTGLGAVPTILGARVSHRIYDTALGLAGGIMIAASVFGLIIPGMEQGSLWEGWSVCSSVTSGCSSATVSFPIFTVSIDSGAGTAVPTTARP